MVLGIRFVRWGDVDLALHAFDPALARAVALEAMRSAVGDNLQRNRPGGVGRERTLRGERQPRDRHGHDVSVRDGTYEVWLLALPSWPSPFCPQHQMDLSLRRAQV